MYKPYQTPVDRAFPDIETPEPRVSAFMVLMAKLFGRLYLFLFLGIARIFLRGKRYFFDSFDRALRGKSRCIIAVRHPYGGEPQMLSWYILFKFRALAKRGGYTLARAPHTVFVYGYEVVRWGGAVARLVMPRLGAMPVHHTKVDTRGMSRIYKAITEGPYPLSIAPEGQVSYTAEAIPRLEQGAIRIGFHAAERLQRSGSDCPVEILPVSAHFRYGSWGKFALKLLIGKIEKYTGLRKKNRAAGNLSLEESVLRCREHILAANERRYGLQVDTAQPYAERVNAVMDAAMNHAEMVLGLRKGGGEVIDRMYHLRQICWDRIYLPGTNGLDDFSSVERSIADLRAGEAWHAGRHLEVVDFSWYFRNPPPAQDAPLHTRIEYVQNLWDFANRTMGGAYANRTNIFPRCVIFRAAPPINLSARLPEYRTDRKALVRKVMDELKDAYLDCIEKEATGDNKD
ncbi:MAG: acyltransferase [Treponema sp.]|jgi:1-acyl-sn-glycerol-3-phosphate acyltransferase|nr:acyltransferase [Treponema sp.]